MSFSSFVRPTANGLILIRCRSRRRSHTSARPGRGEEGRIERGYVKQVDRESRAPGRESGPVGDEVNPAEPTGDCVRQSPREGGSEAHPGRPVGAEVDDLDGRRIPRGPCHTSRNSPGGLTRNGQSLGRGNVPPLPLSVAGRAVRPMAKSLSISEISRSW